VSPYRTFPQFPAKEPAPRDWRLGFLGFVIIVLLAVGGPQIGCGGAQLTAQEQTNITLEEAQQVLCVTQNIDAGRAVVDACRARVKAQWNSYWAAELDGGVE
jgi:hypothetical protein